MKTLSRRDQDSLFCKKVKVSLYTFDFCFVNCCNTSQLMLLIGSRLLKLLVTTKCISTRIFVYLFLFNFLLLQQTNSTSSRKSQIINHLFYCFLKIALSQYHIKKKQGDGDCLSFFPIIQSWPNHCAPLLFDTDIDSAIYLHQCKHHNDHDDNALYHGPDMCCRDPISSMIPRHLQNPNQEKRASCLCSIIFPLTKTSVGKLLSSVLRFFHRCKQKLALFIREGEKQKWYFF